MNIENYKKVLKQITDNPETWCQTLWHCDTKHCLAGWAQILSGQPEVSRRARIDARLFLELTPCEADWLFCVSRRLEQLADAADPTYLADRIAIETVIGDRVDTLDSEGYYSTGYDKEGYARDGYDRDGLDRNLESRQ